MSLDIKMNNTQPIYIYNGVDEIPEDVTHVRVDLSVTVIPEQAFYGLEKLEEVELPEGLITIKEYAFDNCSLKRINIPSTLVEIGNSAFNHCDKLDGIVLPEGLRQLGTWAFCHCESLKSINIPQTITTIEQAAFLSCYNLKEVTCSEGLLEIEQDVFSFCRSLSSITLPPSLKVIGKEAFDGCSLLNEMYLPDSIETIADGAFNNCNFQRFRIPPLVTKVNKCIFGYSSNKGLVSLELSTNVRKFEHDFDEDLDEVLSGIRNISMPTNCITDVPILESCTELGLAFPNAGAEAILSSLEERFDDLAIHKICYYQSYHDTETTMQNLRREINPWTSKFPGQLNTTGKQQDCLGMTPLHILACSTKPKIEMYQLLIDKYPETLVIKDKWGDIPLIYAIWCNASTEALDLLVENYKSLHPDYEFNWSGMLLTLAKRNVPLVNIEKLINTQQHSFPDQEYNVQVVVGELAKCYTRAAPRRSASTEVFRYLLRVSTTKRLDILGITKWRLDLENSIGAFRDETERERTTKALYDRLDMYELAKEATSILELATWKHKMDESTPSSNAKSTGQSNKRARVDTNISERQQYRVNCGANIVVRNVLPYLLPK